MANKSTITKLNVVGAPSHHLHNVWFSTSIPQSSNSLCYSYFFVDTLLDRLIINFKRSCNQEYETNALYQNPHYEGKIMDNQTLCILFLWFCSEFSKIFQRTKSKRGVKVVWPFHDERVKKNSSDFDSITVVARLLARLFFGSFGTFNQKGFPWRSWMFNLIFERLFHSVPMLLATRTKVDSYIRL